MTLYVGLIDGKDGAWGVRIPDFPGCHGGGATPEAAVADVTSALREFAADMIASGEAIPAPSDLGKILERQKRAKAPRSGVVYIRLLLEEGRPVKANISLDARTLRTIDDEAKRRGLTRSAFMTSAALEKIERG